MEVQRRFSILKQSAFAVALALTAIFFTGGCASETMTNPARSATEQLLLSTAADRAMAEVDLRLFASRRVYVDTTYYDSYDSKYAIGEIRDAISRAGALLVANSKESDTILEVRSGALSTDSDSSLIGVPTLVVPIPFSGTPLQIPEIAFYKSEPQLATAKLALLAYETRTAQHVFSSGPLLGKAYNNYHKILFISWLTDDIPEKKTARKAPKYQVWYPQYDTQNMPPTWSGPVTPPALTNSPPPSTNVVK